MPRKNIKISVLAIILAILLASLAVVSVLANNNPEFFLYMNGERLDTKEALPAYLDKNGRTMVPVRFVSENAGYTVVWDNKTREVQIHPDGCGCKDNHYEDSHKILALTIGENELWTKGGTIIMDTTAVLKNDRTYIPIRYICENLGLYVSYRQGRDDKGNVQHYVYITDQEQEPSVDNGYEDEGKVPEGIVVVDHDDDAYLDKNDEFLGGIFLKDTGIAIKNPEWAYNKTLTIDEHFNKIKEIMEYLDYGYTPNGFIWNDPYPESVIGGESLSLTKVDNDPSVVRLWVNAWRGPGDIGDVGRINVTINQYLNVCRYWMPNQAANDWYAYMDEACTTLKPDLKKHNFTYETIDDKKYEITHTVTNYTFVLDNSLDGGSFAIYMPTNY